MKPPKPECNLLCSPQTKKTAFNLFVDDKRPALLIKSPNTSASEARKVSGFDG